MITFSNFIKACARRMKDPDFVSVSISEWREIINAQAAELFPQIVYKHEETFSSLSTYETTYHIDLSTYSGLEDVESVQIEDSDGKRFPYTNWTFDRKTKIINLDPSSYKSEIDPLSYTKIHITWKGFLPSLEKDDDEISLTASQISLLEKICVKEGMTRTLYDRTKLQVYRTTYGEMNEYSLLAIIRNLTAEIEMEKRNLQNSSSLRYF